MASWSVLVTIHNLVNIPLTACENGPRTFAVEAHMLHRASAYAAPVAAAIFTTDDVVSTTPNLFEVRLDEVAENATSSGGGPKVWRCALPEMEAVVMVKEIIGSFTGPYRPRSRDGSGGDGGNFTVDGTRVVGSSAPVAVNVKDVVEVDKLATRVVGTEMGQVGLSFAVDPGDKSGYQHRLESFLRVHNPQGLRLVPSVVEAVTELDTFTKLYRRYKVRDYEARLSAFFDVYGAQFKQEIPSLLRQWDGREEELMRNLILDNGPELSTVEPHQRLTAYLAAHQLDRKSPDVQAILAAHANAPGTDALFAALVERFGPEPDPRPYLFVKPRYSPASTSASSSRHGISVLQGESVLSAPPERRLSAKPSSPETPPPQRPASARSGVPRRSPPTPADSRHLLSVAMSPTPKAAEAVSQDTARSLSKSPSFRADKEKSGVLVVADARTAEGDHRGKGGRTITPSDRVVVSGTGARGDAHWSSGGGGGSGAGRRSATLWRKMCSMMQARHRASVAWREHQLFFMSRDEFVAAVRALHTFHDGGDDGSEVQDLAEEWQRRVNAALRQDTLVAADAYYGAAVQEAAALAGLQPLHMHVLSITSLFHKQQYTGFSAYVEEEAKASRTERLVLVGDAERLMGVARYGFHAALDVSGGARTVAPSFSGAGESIDSGTPILFFREPFSGCKDKVACAVLICEVAVGKTFVCPSTVHTPRDPSADFLAAYDSCSYVDEAKGPTVAVYNRQQVFPRLLLRCVVDPALQPCPAHPDKAVEYYVMDTHAFACSRCVVLGAYKGKEVVPVDEAAVLARAGLAEMERTATALQESMLAYANQLRNEEASMATAPRHVEAEREIDRLQREVEERVRRIRHEVQLEDEAQLSRIHADRAEVEATLAVARQLSAKLDSAMHRGTAVETVNALQHLQQENEIEQLLLRAQTRVPAAPLERVLPLDGPGDAPPASAAGLPLVAGLNESRFAAADAEGKRHLRPTSRQPDSSPGQHHSATKMHDAASADGDLYSQYLALSNKAANTSNAAPSQSHRPGKTPPPPSAEVRDGGASVAAMSAKEALTQGWALLRRGDVAGAQRAWSTVCETHGASDVLGTKAHAYIAEAIQKDYAAAAQWYARSLQLDPQDRMTAYNYGVLLEALLGQPQEALRMYDRAASLGDGVAAARARELRASLEG